MQDQELNSHQARSKEKEIELLAIHWIHLIRAYNRALDEQHDYEGWDEAYTKGWNEALNSLKR